MTPVNGLQDILEVLLQEDLPVEFPLALLLFVELCSVASWYGFLPLACYYCLSMKRLGIIAGIYAEKWDQVSTQNAINL